MFMIQVMLGLIAGFGPLVLLGYIFCKLVDWYYEGHKPWDSWGL